MNCESVGQVMGSNGGPTAFDVEQAYKKGHAAGMAEVVEKCIEIAYKCIQDNQRYRIAAEMRALSPDPHFLERERLKARLRTLEQRANRWPPFGAIATVEDRDVWIAQRHEETMWWIAETKRQLAALDKPKEEK